MEFENVVAEACWTLYENMPLAYETFESNGWTHVLVDYSPALLANIGADERVRTELARTTNSRAGTAWLMVHVNSCVVREAGLYGRYAQAVTTAFEAMLERVDAAS